MEAGGSAVQIHPQLHIELEASLGCMKPCLQTDKQGDKEQRYRAWDHLGILHPLALLEVGPVVFIFVLFGERGCLCKPEAIWNTGGFGGAQWD